VWLLLLFGSRETCLPAIAVILLSFSFFVVQGIKGDLDE
jgi:hypothetical protein